MRMLLLSASACVEERDLGALVSLRTDDFEKQEGKYYPMSTLGPKALHITLHIGPVTYRQGRNLDQKRVEIARMLVDAGASVNRVLRQ
jgi:hypothetical protein